MGDVRIYPALAALAITAVMLVVWPHALGALFASDFLPHAQCYLWRPGLIGLHLITDAAIGLSYVAISFSLIYFVRRRVDLPFNRMFVAFGVFIIACGATHLMEIWTLWQPVYWLAGAVKVVTALASVATALLLPPLIPKALALPSPTLLTRANAELAQEVTERRAAEARVRALLESAPDGIFLMSGEGAIELVNERAEAMFGYARRELLGLPITRLLSDPAIATADRQRVEVPGRRRDGSTFPTEVSVSPLANAERRLLTVVVRDISERRRLEEERADRVHAEVARAQAEELGRRASFLAEASRLLAGSLDYEATLKSIARVSIPYLADYVLIDALDAGGRLHRLAAAHADPTLEERLAHRPPYALADAGDSVIGAVLEHGEPTLVRDVSEEWLAARHVDAAHLGVTAGMRAASLMLVPLRARGRMLGVVTFALDPGPRRYALADLALAEDLAQRAALSADNARLYREAQDASRAKDEFLAVLSHELRTPLTPVLGWIRMLRTGTLPPPTAERALDTIERNTRLQVQLVEDLLDVSRIITGKLKLDLQSTSIALVVDLAVESIAGSAATKSITVRREVAEGLPPLHADANRLQQVLTNLLSNAVKFTATGGRVEIIAAQGGDGIELTVSDTGTGLTPETAPHIFDRFHQADSTITRQHGGLGLGLAIVRHIVELHGGSVRASSPGSGQGTTFTVLLPVAGPAVRLDIATPAEPAPPPALRPDALAGVRVLVVDDEPDSRDVVAAVLERTGAEVATATSTQEALRLIDKHLPEVLVSDLAMPHEDGYALLRELRARGRTARLTTVALSAQARPEDRRRALQAGYDAHIAKPVEPAALALLVKELVQKRRRQS